MERTFTLQNYIMNDQLNEAPIFTTRIHWISNVKPVASIVLSPIILYILSEMSPVIFKTAAFILIVVFLKSILRLLRNLTAKFEVFESRFTVTHGILNRETNDIQISKLEGMALIQGFVGRLLGFGSLTVSTGEITGTYKVANPLQLRSAILNAKN